MWFERFDDSSKVRVQHYVENKAAFSKQIMIIIKIIVVLNFTIVIFVKKSLLLYKIIIY